MEDPGSAQSKDDGARAALSSILHNLQNASQPPPGADAALLADLTAYVLGQINTPALNEAQTEELTTLATKYAGQKLQDLLANVGLRFRLDSLISSGRVLGARQQARANRNAGPTLATLAGVSNGEVKLGEVSMGIEFSMSGHEPAILWTSALAGCVGVAIYGGGKSFLAHYKPDQLNHNGNPSDLDNTVRGISRQVQLNGASLWMSSPSQNAPYYTNLRQRLVNAGANLVAQYTADTLALRTTDGTVFQNFPPPPSGDSGK